MSVVNRRNAVIGWLAVKLGKRTAKKKAQVVPTTGLVAGALAALGGLIALKRKNAA